MEVLVAVTLLIGLVIGGAVGWILRGSRPGGDSAATAANHESEIANLNLQHEQQLGEQRQVLADQRIQHEQQLAANTAEISRLKGLLEQAATAQELLETAKSQLGEQFKATASDVLQSSNKQFMELSEQNLGKTMEQAKGELDKRHQQFQELVKPLSENYGKLNPQIDLLLKESGRITEETSRLRTVLSDNRQVGHWGEVQLRNVAQLAGLVDYCDFEEQVTLSGTQVRLDMVVKLPERRKIVIDAKASITAYLEAQQAEDPDSADSAWTRHARALRNQVDDLAGKNYGAIVEGSLDFVVMFVPGDQFLAAALRSNPTLVDYAIGKRVAIATPASLIAMMWAVNNGWQQFRLAQDAARIKEVGDDMYKRLNTFIGHYNRVGKELQSAVTAYNQSVGSFDQRLAPKGREFARLVVGNDDGFSVPGKIDGLPSTSAYALDSEGEEHLTAAADN